jgi:hypothetical protein
MGGIAVAQFMGEDAKAELAPCLLHGPLHIGLMHAVTDQCVAERVAAGVVGQKLSRPDFVFPALNIRTRPDADFAYCSGNEELTSYEESQFPACNMLTDQNKLLFYEAGNRQLMEKRTRGPLAGDIQRPVA